MFDKADYRIRDSVSHVRHEGMPPFSQGEWGTVTYVLCFPGSCMPTDLSTDYGVYFFVFLGVASPRSELRETFYERWFLGYPHFVHLASPALWSKHDYDHCVHNTTVYL